MSRIQCFKLSEPLSRLAWRAPCSLAGAAFGGVAMGQGDPVGDPVTRAVVTKVGTLGNERATLACLVLGGIYYCTIDRRCLYVRNIFLLGCFPFLAMME